MIQNEGDKYKCWLKNKNNQTTKKSSYEWAECFTKIENRVEEYVWGETEEVV
jgi:hypothetical protein